MDLETNAGLVTEEIMGSFVSWDPVAGVSLDGTPDLQNHEEGCFQKSSAEAVERGIRNLQKFYVGCGRDHSGDQAQLPVCERNAGLFLFTIWTFIL